MVPELDQQTIERIREAAWKAGYPGDLSDESIRQLRSNGQLLDVDIRDIRDVPPSDFRNSNDEQ